MALAEVLKILLGKTLLKPELKGGVMCVHTCVYMCPCICMCLCRYVSMHLCLYMRLCASVCVCMYIGMHAHVCEL